MPPVVTTRVMATATISKGAFWRITLSRLPLLRKLSVTSANNRQQRAKNSAMLATPG